MDLATKFSTPVAASRKLVRVGTIVRISVFLLVLAALAALGWSYATRSAEIVGSRVSRGPVADVVYATGFVEPRSPVDVSSRVTAPVVRVLVDEGDRVVVRQPLAILDAEDQRQAIAQLTATRVNAEQDEGRALAIFRKGWSTNADRDKAIASANSARALEAAAKAKLGQYTIRAGIAGIILRRDVEPGDLATSSKTLFQIGAVNNLRVTATVDERDIPLVRVGSSVMMSTEAYPGRIFRGSVYEITPGGDPDQRAFRVRIRPDGPTSFPVGLTLEVNIVAAERSHVMLVPAGALRDGGVWVAASGHARHVPVQVGIRGMDRIEIRKGLTDGACVLTDPPATLKNGERISVKGC
jgi:RND family efflux transporter MFP subunit